MPVFFVGLFIYSKDKDKEPIGLLVKLFFGGVGALFLSLVITLILAFFVPGLLFDDSNLSFVELLFQVFFCIALVEEFSKWIFLYKISFSHKEFDQVYDMIVYAVFVALGFACIENIFYVFDNGFGVAFLRALLAVPGHACNGIFMGYYLSMAKLAIINENESLKSRNMFLSLLVPVLLHGIYDFCLFTGNVIFVLLFFVFIVVLYVKSIKKIKKISSSNRKIKYNDNYCPNCCHKVDSNFCPGCGRKK